MQKIISLLKKIAKQKSIRIIFSVESGSREWGISSKDSDFDVRVVFCHSPKSYYSLRPYAQDFRITKGDVDVHFMELRKFVQLLLNSNPTCVEWLQSKTIYVGEKPKVFMRFLKDGWSAKALSHHYAGLCKNNYQKYLKTYKEPTLKRYLYACKGWLSGLFVLKYGVLPPISFGELVEQAPITIKQRLALREIIKAKREGHENKLVKNMPDFDKWLCSFINKKIPLMRKKFVNILPYERFVIRTIEEMI